MNDTRPEASARPPRRRAARTLATALTGGLLLATAGLLAPGTAQAITSVDAPTLSGEPDPATVGLYYSFFFTTTGAPAPTCAVSAGTLPPGLALGSNDCRLTGTPTADGDYPFSVTASNGTNPDAVHATTITVQSYPSLTDVTVPNATAGEPYSYRLPLAGVPTPTVAWTRYDALPAGLTLDPDGLIHGTPTTSTGRLNVGITLSNSVGDYSYTLWFTVDPQRPQITSADPPDVRPGQPYSFQFTATGVPAPMFYVDANSLPRGLSVDQRTGLLSGTTTEVGDFPITLLVSSNLGSDDRRDYTLHVVGTAPHVTNSPPAGTVGVGYGFTFDTGDTYPTPTFTLESGTLPTGLTVFSNGYIGGTPQQAGPGSPVTLRAHNGVDPDATITFTIPVTGSALGISGTPPPATQWLSYYFTYRVTGAPRPSITVTDGQLPPGLTLDSYGTITGVPSTPGSYTFTLTASNGGASADVSTVSTVVVGSQVTIGGAPPDADLGRPYSYSFTVSGAPAPTVTLTGGALPPGLTLSPTGTLTGTPTQDGFFSFVLLADNGVQHVSYGSSVQVNASITTLAVGDVSQAEGNSGTRPMAFRISLNAPSTTSVTVHWSTANGTARAGSDYVAASGTVTFLPGQTTKTVVVQVKGDRIKEPTETFHIRLSNVRGATIADGNALGRILNDD